MNSLRHLLFFLFVALILSGCGTDDKTAILGIWKVKTMQVDGKEVGDGKSWFEFKENGTVDTRPRPGKYNSGNYTINPEKKLLVLTSDEGSMHYNYRLEGDELDLDAEMPNQMHLNMKCEKVNDYPITQENDALEDTQQIFNPGSGS